jgi:nicotinate phosphoribosyltransferase
MPGPTRTAPPTALLTDLYEITMAYSYWKAGRHAHEAAYHLYFRDLPFGGGYAVACGLGPACDFLERFCFGDDDLAYLAGLTGADGAPLFDPEFLDWLGALRLSLDVDMVDEGEAVFPNEPLVRVVGPIAEAQLVETTLLTLVGFSTLVATKAARVRHAAGDDEVLEFGLRRAQGPDGGLSASRAAFVGGCTATSDVLAGKLYDIPVRGTHAHSWVMSFDTEPEAFAAYADAMPNNGVFLVDTYDTLDGVRHAIETGHALRARGQRLLGVRLDSGDLAALSVAARALLDAAGFADAVVMATNDLDEHRITALKAAGARIDVWGVGTRLATAYDEPALGAVYKLAAVREPGGAWVPRVKHSEQAVKASTPGLQQVRRFADGGVAAGDVIWDELTGPPERDGVDLLSPTFRAGRRVRLDEPVADARERAISSLGTLPPDVRRLVDPADYPVALEPRLAARREALLRER